MHECATRPISTCFNTRTRMFKVIYGQADEAEARDRETRLNDHKQTSNICSTEE